MKHGSLLRLLNAVKKDESLRVKYAPMLQKVTRDTFIQKVKTIKQQMEQK